MTKITVTQFCCLLIIPMMQAKFCVLPSGFYQDKDDIKFAVVEERLSNDNLVQSCCVQTDTDILYSTQDNHSLEGPCHNDPYVLGLRENDFQMTLGYTINKTYGNEKLSKKFVFKEINKTNIETENILVIGKIAKFICGSSEKVNARCIPPITMTTETSHDITVTAVNTENTQPSTWETHGNYIIYSILGSVIVVLLIITGCQCVRISRMKNMCYKMSTNADNQDKTLTNTNLQNISEVDSHATKHARKSIFEFWTPRFITNGQDRGNEMITDKSNAGQKDGGARKQRRKSYLLSWVPKMTKQSKETIEIQSKITENSASGISDGLVWSNIHHQVETKSVRSKNEYVLTSL